ncbi:phage FluMu protein Com [Sporomusaceae bacterium BoRhaA]|uniref:hypothetical protein n=1 Tax=Pelorhabdus rhamnosifermentans TaxID=2772457 RepID=UPI001C060043|nr:hypothetical protein [Pelorhabdus rhamnosifermentans]MBU2702340.1 phage FluMu protein Com [Pelorhabdus rhamnosifermentans]
MCFRPAGVAKSQVCPKCGKKLMPIGGVMQKKCPFCKTDLTNLSEEKQTKQTPPKA